MKPKRRIIATIALLATGILLALAQRGTTSEPPGPPPNPLPWENTITGEVVPSALPTRIALLGCDGTILGYRNNPFGAADEETWWHPDDDNGSCGVPGSRSEDGYIPPPSDQ